MIDTIQIIQPFRTPQEVEDCIQFLKENYSVDKNTRSTSDNSKAPFETHTCYDNGFKIWIAQNNIYLQGSLTKLYFGNNFLLLNSNQLQEAYSILQSRYYFIDWSRAIHKRIDIGVSIQLPLPPSSITGKIVGCKRMKKTNFESNGESVVIGNTSHQIIFYDQTACAKKEMAKNGLENTVPENLLRIEYKLFNKYQIMKHFGTKNVTVEFILDNVNRLPEIWYTMYSDVEKDYTATIGLFRTQREMEMKAIIECGIDSIRETLEISYKANLLSKSTKQNIKKYLSTIEKFKSANASSTDSIKVLDSKIKTFMQNNTFSQSKLVA
ncbi:phage/plasmid replication domain-containing protein [Larkinella sp. VNQ87]|uniref:phage/plasmid replication domain-containing protein n=1 Tax=Larkinella sp. VNQ87 TaxID=3400921 RepID=UPI003C0F7279